MPAARIILSIACTLAPHLQLQSVPLCRLTTPRAAQQPPASHPPSPSHLPPPSRYNTIFTPCRKQPHPNALPAPTPTHPPPESHCRLWLALRHGLVTMFGVQDSFGSALWLALRHGLVTISTAATTMRRELWLALRHGLVTIPFSQVLCCQPLAPQTAQNNSSCRGGAGVGLRSFPQ
jgi:hypothetical protein